MPFVMMQEDTAPNDQEFILSIYEEYKKIMFSKAKRYLGGEDAVEDIVQDVMLKLIQKVQKLRGLDRYTLTAYIVCSIRNTAIDYLRRKQTHDKYTVPLYPDEASEEYISWQVPEDLLLHAESRERFYQAWERLAEEDRILLSGKYVFCHSDAELAQDLGCAPSSIRMKITRAKRKAMAVFQPEVLIHDYS